MTDSRSIHVSINDTITFKWDYFFLSSLRTVYVSRGGWLAFERNQCQLDRPGRSETAWVFLITVFLCQRYTQAAFPFPTPQVYNASASYSFYMLETMSHLLSTFLPHSVLQSQKISPAPSASPLHNHSDTPPQSISEILWGNTEWWPPWQSDVSGHCTHTQPRSCLSICLNWVLAHNPASPPVYNHLS